MREAVRAAWQDLAARFSDVAPSLDEVALRSRYGAIEAWPADAEFGLVVLGWALGPGFACPGLRPTRARGRGPAFALASHYVAVRSSLPSVITLCGIACTGFRNGAVVVDRELNPEVLYWPWDLSRCKGARV